MTPERFASTARTSSRVPGTNAMLASNRSEVTSTRSQGEATVCVSGQRAVMRFGRKAAASNAKRGAVHATPVCGSARVTSVRTVSKRAGKPLVCTVAASATQPSDARAANHALSPLSTLRATVTQ